ncbi:hypothetical protein EVAR_4181_1 [Eumeta japonica]|uniref:Uncharacterized protein n=1 Tax=Eumeta variegata TaxID=151549 RepID=A0A4C1TG01_EUMVA|nr:hypothetical protein EVAR_4181_1 [Eumeta japonica]
MFHYDYMAFREWLGVVACLHCITWLSTHRTEVIEAVPLGYLVRLAVAERPLEPDQEGVGEDFARSARGYQQHRRSQASRPHGCQTEMRTFTVIIQSIDGDCLHNLKEYECGLRMDELSVKCLLYADDQKILAPSACEVQGRQGKGGRTWQIK